MVHTVTLCPSGHPWLVWLSGGPSRHVIAQPAPTNHSFLASFMDHHLSCFKQWGARITNPNLDRYTSPTWMLRYRVTHTCFIDKALGTPPLRLTRLRWSDQGNNRKHVLVRMNREALLITAGLISKSVTAPLHMQGVAWATILFYRCKIHFAPTYPLGRRCGPQQRFPYPLTFTTRGWNTPSIGQSCKVARIECRWYGDVGP